MRFELQISNKNDSIRRPTAGEVKGTYKIFKDRELGDPDKTPLPTWKMVVDTAERSPLKQYH
ncbi:MAG: hypothetical protein ACREQC_05470 [Candidatus Binataceae bacterium]